MNQFYELSYDELKHYLLNTTKENQEKILKDNRIKRKLIDSPRKYDFIWLAQIDNNNIMPLLLDEKGIQILKDTEDLCDKMNGILTSDQKYVDSLFEKDSFCEIVLSYFHPLQHYFSSLDGTSATLFYQYLTKQEVEEEKEEFLYRLNEKSQLYLVQTIELPFLMLKKVLTRGKRKAIEEVLNHDLRITTLSDLSFRELWNLSNKNVRIPPLLFDEEAFVKRVSSITNVKDYRFLMQNLERENDTEKIEKRRKKYYEQEMKDYDKNYQMLKEYRDAYKSYEENPDCDWNELWEKFSFYDNSMDEYLYSLKLKEYYDKKDKDGMKEFLQQESNLKLTDMIIDYHYKEIYYNFLLDIKQLYRLQQTEGKTLSEEEIKQYETLIQLDSLSYDEKMAFHEELKKKNRIEEYYDHMKEAKKKIFQMMDDVILDEEALEKHEDKALSLQFGVPISLFEQDPFYAFVKSYSISKKNVLTTKYLHSHVDGASYSLDSNQKLSTYSSPREYYNILYGNIPLNQIVHMYPVDSFSKYIRESNSNGTPRVFEFYTPEEFVNRGRSYNEIILAQKNESRKDELNNQLLLPTPLAIYCYDKVLENDVISAKNLNIGIALIKTKSYEKKKIENQISMMDTIGYEERYKRGIDYIESIGEDAMHGRRTK